MTLRDWLEECPPGTLVRAGEILARLDASDVPNGIHDDLTTYGKVGTTAAERLWSCPDQTRYTVTELAAALNRPKSYIYKHTANRTIPFTKIDGQNTFIVSEVRRWVVDREERINGNGVIRRVN